jgi:hypothetical protein
VVPGPAPLPAFHAGAGSGRDKSLGDQRVVEGGDFPTVVLLKQDDGAQNASDRDEVRAGAERLAKGGAVCAVSGPLKALHDRLHRNDG